MTEMTSLFNVIRRGATEAGVSPGQDRLDDARLSSSLKLFACFAALSAASGVVIYCYESTLAASRPALAAIHEYSGDAAALLLSVYLVQHLRRTWGLRRSRPLSWWTGIVGAACWAFAAASGVWGQFAPLPRYETLWWIHAAASFAAVVVVGAHAAYGFRARTNITEQSTQ